MAVSRDDLLSGDWDWMPLLMAKFTTFFVNKRSHPQWWKRWGIPTKIQWWGLLFHLWLGMTVGALLQTTRWLKHKINRAVPEKCYHFLFGFRILETVLSALRGFKGYIDDGKVPQQNVERARKIQTNMGDEFSFLVQEGFPSLVCEKILEVQRISEIYKYMYINIWYSGKKKTAVKQTRNTIATCCVLNFLFFE